MSDLSIARRYAQALYREAVELKKTDRVDDDVQLIQATLESSRELVRLFESPVVTREKKELILSKIFGDRVDPVVSRLLKLLIDKNREDLFPIVIRAYTDLRDRQMGTTVAKVRTARTLDPADEKLLVSSLEKLTGKRVRLTVTLEPELLGGVVVRIGDTVYDGSVRNQLSNLKDQLANASYMAGSVS